MEQTFTHLNGYRVEDETARKEINILKNMKMIMLGDSFGVLNSDNDITRFYWDYVREGLGLTQDITFFPLFQSGAGFGNNNFIDNLRIVSNYVGDKEEVTDIFVCGGWNDHEGIVSDIQFNNAIELFNDYVKENYPYARVTIAHISWGNPLMVYNYNVFQQLPGTIARYKKACNKYGWRYLRGVEHILHIYEREYWQSDGTHPNQSGQERLGSNLVAPFLTGSCDVYETKLSTPTPAGVCNSLENIQSFNYINDNMVQVTFDCITPNTPIVFHCDGTSISLNGGQNYLIGKLNSPYLAGFSSTNLITVPCVLYGVCMGSDNSFSAQCTLFVDRGNIYIRPMLIASKNIVDNFILNAIVFTGFKVLNATLIS